MKLKQEVVGDEDILSEEEVPGQEHIITITHWMELECTVGGGWSEVQDTEDGS